MSLSVRAAFMRHPCWTSAGRCCEPGCHQRSSSWSDYRRIRNYTAAALAGAPRSSGRSVWTVHPSRRMPSKSSDLESETATANDSNTESPQNTATESATRNKKLAAVIREGITYLNQSAAAIQNNSHTGKGIFMSPEEQHGPDARQLSEENRIFTTAQECLEDMCRRDPSFPLMAADEPILLLDIKVKPSYSHADIYWSLPYRVLSAPELNERQKEFLKDKMEERLQGAPGRMLIRRINAMLSSYYPPKIRFKAAPPLLIHQMLYDLEED